MTDLSDDTGALSKTDCGGLHTLWV